MILKNNTYSVQGLDLLELSNKFGTPLYVYDGDKIVKQVQKFKEAFAEVDLRIKYAAKALTNISVLKLLKKAGTEVDVVSIPEARVAMRAGFTSEEILFTPSSASLEDIKEAVDLGLFINIDSLSLLEKFGMEYKNSVSCCIRINPHIMAGGNVKISTGHVNSKFGISVEQLEDILDIVRKYDIDIKGLHLHTGSDIKDANIFLESARVIFGIAHHFPNLSFIDLGSGFKVPYKDDEHVLDINFLGSEVSKAFKNFCKNYGRNLELWFEPGKFLVSECGVLLVKVNVVKKNPTLTFVGVNSGLNHLIRPMMYDGYHTIVNISNPEGKKDVYTVVGYICETDTLGSDRWINEVREGDILAIKNAGAYGFSMSSNYNSRFRPAEVLIYNGQAKLIRQRETMEDILRGQIEVEL